jgi:hypothetical protein
VGYWIGRCDVTDNAVVGVAEGSNGDRLNSPWLLRLMVCVGRDDEISTIRFAALKSGSRLDSVPALMQAAGLSPIRTVGE